MKILISLFISIFSFSCTNQEDYFKTVDKVDMSRFMKKWYVVAARPSSFEEGAHNSVEHYSWNEKEKRIDIDFTFNKDSFDGEVKKIPQKGWIHNSKTNAHWKVQPFFPLKLDYLILDLADDYSWTAVGVPSQKYLWIMTHDWNVDESLVQMIIKRLDSKGYSTKNIIRIPQSWGKK